MVGSTPRARGDVAEGDAFVDALGDREDHHCRGDAADGETDLEQSPEHHAGVAVAADDVLGVIQDGVVEPERRDREDEGPRNQAPIMWPVRFSAGLRSPGYLVAGS